MSLGYKELTGDFIIVGLIKTFEGVLGARVLDTRDNTCSDEYLQVIESHLKSGITFRNAKLENGKLVGRNGRLERYPYVTDTNGALTIIEQYVDESDSVVGYRVANNAGVVFKWKKENLVKALKEMSNGGVEPVLTNGKFDGSRISPILGLYPSVKMPSKAQEPSRQKDNKKKQDSCDIDKKVALMVSSVCKFYSEKSKRSVKPCELKYYPFGFYFGDTGLLKNLVGALYNRFGTVDGLSIECAKDVILFSVKGREGKLVYTKRGK